nr:protein kinase [Clostridia bacterium]
MAAWKLSDFELISEWKNSNCGQTALGTNGGKTYFLKKYTDPVHPLNNGSMSEKTYNHNKAKFDVFERRRTDINKALRAVSGAGGNIVIPMCEFREENFYMEAAELVPGVVSREDIPIVLDGLTMEAKKTLMLTAAGALGTVHGQNIIHSDLKLENVLLVKNEFSGKYVAKIIDFDSSYFVGDIPDEVRGDLRFYSPELQRYTDAEEDEERDELKPTLTVKSDIFSLGIIFHLYLTGEFPEPDSLPESLQRRKDAGGKVYCSNVILAGCVLKASDKITDDKYRFLIADMLEKDPTKRPTANEVVMRLKTEGPEPSEFDSAWPEHGIMIVEDRLKADGIIRFKQKLSADKKLYELRDKNGRSQVMTKEELMSAGYGVIVGGVDEPWPGDNIEFTDANLDNLEKRGYFRTIKRKEVSGKKVYVIYSTSGMERVMPASNMKAFGFATDTKPRSSSSYTGGSGSSSPVRTPTPPAPPAPSVTTFCEPWPEDNIEWDMDAIKAKGYVGIECATTPAGAKGYYFYREGGRKQFFAKSTLLAFKYAKNK